MFVASYLQRSVRSAAMNKGAVVQLIAKEFRKSQCGRFMSTQTGFDYDIIVIGGGSGGIACAREVSMMPVFDAN